MVERFFMRLKFLLITSYLIAFSSPQNSFADSETEALRAQIKALEARLDQLEAKQHSTSIAKPVAKNEPAQNQSDIAKRLNIVERNQELVQDDLKAKAEKTPTIEVGAKGLSITSPDKQYSLRLRAYAQADTRTFQNNTNTSNVDNFLIRSARPILDAKMGDYVNGRIMLDFGNNQTRLTDAYADIKTDSDSKLLAFRIGKQKVPVGLERWQSEQETPFVERGLATNLVPFRDVGVSAFGEILPNKLEYNIGVSNGAVDLGDNNGASGDNKDISARIFAKPITGLGVGMAGTYGNHHGTATSPNLSAGYVTIAQSKFFSYSSNVFADGTKWRLNPQVVYYNGAFGALGEYVMNSQEVSKAAAHNTLKNDGWTAMVSYVVTGEDASFDGVKPDKNFDWKKGNYGAFEILARTGELNVDKSAFGTFSDANASARKAQELTIGANWYFSSSLKFNFDLSHTRFDGGATGGADRESENVLLTRTQFRF
jgi:phosphate-selective porin OprO/OprP